MSKALVCSGGGSLGAWQGGAIQALADSGRRWAHYAGVSVGSLNAACMSMNADSQAQAAFLKTLWLKVEGNKDVYKAHAPWLLKYIWQFWKQSLYTMKPLRDMAERNYVPGNTLKAKHTLHVGLTNLETGEYRSIKACNLTRPEAADVIHASCIFPGLFQPVNLDGELYIDGGVRNTIPILDVLSQHGVEEVDVVLTSPRSATVPKKGFKSAIDVGLHAANILAHEVYKNDLEVICHEKYNLKLNIYEPHYDLSQDPFDFDPVKIRELWLKGYSQVTKEIYGSIKRS